MAAVTMPLRRRGALDIRKGTTMGVRASVGKAPSTSVTLTPSWEAGAAKTVRARHGAAWLSPAPCPSQQRLHPAAFPAPYDSVHTMILKELKVGAIQTNAL